MRAIATDILILGSGGAGLFAALHAKRGAPGLSVTIAVKGLLGIEIINRLAEQVRDAGIGGSSLHYNCVRPGQTLIAA